MEDTTQGSEEYPEFDPQDRLPSEVFRAIKSLEEKGTKDDRLSARTDAICTLLDLMHGLRAGEPAGSYYDMLAIQAWKDGELPPRLSRGRPLDYQTDRRDKIARKIAIVERYREIMNPADPKDKVARPIERVAEEFNVPPAGVQGILRSKRPHKAQLLRMRHGLSDIHEMWFEWERMREKGLAK